MRPINLPLVFLLASCASDPSSPGDRVSPVDDDGDVDTTALTCGSSLDDYCATAPCDRDLATAKQDENLCPASLIKCGPYDVVLTGDFDASTNYYYLGGELVAVESLVLQDGQDCVAGPETFDPPLCATTNRPLPACISSAP